MTYPMGYDGPRKRHPDETVKKPPWANTPTLPKGYRINSKNEVTKLPDKSFSYSTTLTRDEIRKMWLEMFLENNNPPHAEMLKAMLDSGKKQKHGVEEVHPNRVIRWFKKHF